MKEIRFSLRITAEQYLAYYQGTVKNVLVQSHDGQSLQFPANILQNFLDHSGIEGTFAMQYDEQNKFVGIKRL